MQTKVDVLSNIEDIQTLMLPKQSIFLERAGDIISHIHKPEKDRDVDADELIFKKYHRRSRVIKE